MSRSERVGEMLARLNPSSPLPTGDPPTGPPVITPQDIAAACANTDAAGAEIVWRKYVEVGSDAPQTKSFYVTWHRVVQLSIEEDWPSGPRGANWLRKLTILALIELIDPMRCGVCEGTRFRMNRLCPLCKGTGKQPLDQAMRSEIAGIPFPAWRSGWGNRYERVYRMLAAMENTVLYQAAEKLFGEAA
jgi:hypothetical protein